MVVIAKTIVVKGEDNERRRVTGQRIIAAIKVRVGEYQICSKETFGTGLVPAIGDRCRSRTTVKYR